MLTSESIYERFASMSVLVAVTPDGTIVGTISHQVIGAEEGHLRGMAVVPKYAGTGAGALEGRGRMKRTRSTAGSISPTVPLTRSAWRRSGTMDSGHLKRYIVFQVLPGTLGLGPEVWRVPSKCHYMRNRTTYEGALDVDDRLVSGLIGACRRVAENVRRLAPISEKSK